MIIHNFIKQVRNRKCSKTVKKLQLIIDKQRQLIQNNDLRIDVKTQLIKTQEQLIKHQDSQISNREKYFFFNG